MNKRVVFFITKEPISTRPQASGNQEKTFRTKKLRYLGIDKDQCPHLIKPETRLDPAMNFLLLAK